MNPPQHGNAGIAQCLEALETVSRHLINPDADTPSTVRSWHVLDMDWSDGWRFLACWRLCQQTVHRPQRLFYSAYVQNPLPVSAWLPQAGSFEALKPLAQALAAQWQGLLPGTHRLVLDDGAVHLTLHLTTPEEGLAALDTPVDAVFLAQATADPVSAKQGPAWLKSLTRLCRHGTRVVWDTRATPWPQWLTDKGWVIEQSAPSTPNLPFAVATFEPPWPVGRSWRRGVSGVGRQAIVLGAGLAGSAAAWSLAQRGWQVDVFDAAPDPAGGASGLPAGLLAPHVSPDDAPLSQLTRDGVRATRTRATQLLRVTQDWAPCGVLEHRVEGKRALPRAAHRSTPHSWMADWSREATPGQLAQAHLPPGSSGIWHASGAWIRPTPLVQAQLAHPGIRFHGGVRIAGLRRTQAGWRLDDDHGQVVGEAPVLVLACGFDVRALLATLDTRGATLALHALRGQVSWGRMTPLPTALAKRLPPWPVNGYGSFLHGIPDAHGQPFWIVGSTFERGQALPILRPADQHANADRLARLLPALAGAFDPLDTAVQAWAGVRCTLPDRLPAVGSLAPERWPGLHVLTGLGARGLTLSVLAGEMLAAQIEGEPWPVEPKLARKMLATRFASP